MYLICDYQKVIFILRMLIGGLKNKDVMVTKHKCQNSKGAQKQRGKWSSNELLLRI